MAHGGSDYMHIMLATAASLQIAFIGIAFRVLSRRVGHEYHYQRGKCHNIYIIESMALYYHMPLYFMPDFIASCFRDRRRVDAI